MNKSIADVKKLRFNTECYIFSGFLYLFCVLILFLITLQYYNDPEYLLAFLFILALISGCIQFLIYHFKNLPLINIFEKYVAALSTDPTYSISNLATTLGVSEADAKDKVLLFIQKKYFINAELDDTSEHIIFKEIPKESPENDSISSSNVSSTTNENIIICHGCGAKNISTKGQIIECEYCGSPLKN